VSLNVVLAPEHPLIKNEELRIKNLEELKNILMKPKKNPILKELI